MIFKAKQPWTFRHPAIVIFISCYVTKKTKTKKRTNLLYSGNNHSKLAFFFLTLIRDECFFKFYVDLFLNKSFILNINNLCMKSLGTLFVKFRSITIHTLFLYLKPCFWQTYEFRCSPAKKGERKKCIVHED